jgi:polar amino acid transport system permease protein
MLDLIDNYWLYFLVGQYPNGPLGGLALTVALAALGLLLALPLGVLLGLGRVSPYAWLRRPVTALVFAVRGTPLLMVIFWAYFFLPSVTGYKTDQFTTMLIALVLFNGVYLAEIVRAGIQGVPRGQAECARALGLGYWRMMRLVVLPQGLRAMLPSFVNQFVSTIKDTSLGYIIGLTEVSFIASQINTQVFTRPAEVYVTLGVSYFILCFGLSRFAYWLEGRLARKQARSSGKRSAAPSKTASASSAQVTSA